MNDLNMFASIVNRDSLGVYKNHEQERRRKHTKTI